MTLKCNRINIKDMWKTRLVSLQIILCITSIASMLGCTKPSPQSGIISPNNQRPIFRIKFMGNAECKERVFTPLLRKNQNVSDSRTSESILETVIANSKSLECIGGDPKAEYTGEIHIEYMIMPDGSTSEFKVGKNKIRNPNMPEVLIESIRGWRFEETTQTGTDLVKTDYVFE